MGQRLDKTARRLLRRPAGQAPGQQCHCGAAGFDHGNAASPQGRRRKGVPQAHPRDYQYRKAGSASVVPFSSVDKKLGALHEVVFVVQGRTWTSTDRSGTGIVCHYDLAIPRYATGSRLKLSFTVTDEGRRIDAGYPLCEDGKPAPTVNTIHPSSKGMRDGPFLKIDAESEAIRLTGFFSTLCDPLLFGYLVDKGRLYADKIAIKTTYWPDAVNLPDIYSTWTRNQNEHQGTCGGPVVWLS